MSHEILTSSQLQEKLRLFKEQHGAKYHLLTLGYFGSYARNEATENSDVDIVFETQTPNLFKAASMREALVNLLEHPVDVVRWREKMNPRLRARIQKEAVYV